MRAYHLLFEGYKEAKAEFIKHADEQSVNKILDLFRDLVNRNQVYGQERNIDFWRKKGWIPFKELVSKKTLLPTKTQVKRAKLKGQYVEMNIDPAWNIIIPLNSSASCHFGKGTSWCTSAVDNIQFDNYFFKQKKILIYCIKIDDYAKWAIVYDKKTDSTEFYDRNDTHISEEVFTYETNLDPSLIIQNIPMQMIENAYADYSSFVRKIYMWADRPVSSPELVNEIISRRDSEAARIYIMKLGESSESKLVFPEQLSLLAIKYNDEYETFDDISAPESDEYNASYHVLQHIANPSKIVQNTALIHDHEALAFIRNPDSYQRKLALKHNGSAVKYIKNPTEEEKWIALKSNILSIYHIVAPTPEMKEYVLTKKPSLIFAIKNRTEKDNLFALENDREGYVVQSIQRDHPLTLEQQLAAVRANPENLKIIKDPDPAAVSLANNFS
jgi:hypothetical protein